MNKYLFLDLALLLLVAVVLASLFGACDRPSYPSQEEEVKPSSKICPEGSALHLEQEAGSGQIFIKCVPLNTSKET